MTNEHIVKSFDLDLQQINDCITRMASLTETQLTSALKAIVKKDTALAEKVIKGDDQIDGLESEVYGYAVRIIALRQPMAGDLRNIISALKLSGDIERIADYATSIAKRSIILSKHEKDLPPLDDIPPLGELAIRMLHNVIKAFSEKDLDNAVAIWRSDSIIDKQYNKFFKNITEYMSKNPKNVELCTHLMFIAKHLERVGDRCTNIAEVIYYSLTGEEFSDESYVAEH